MLLAILALMFVFTGCAKEEEEEAVDNRDPVDLTQQGWREFENFNYDDAYTMFHDAYGLAPDYADAYSGAGWSLYMTGDNEGAASVWQRGLNTSEPVADLDVGLGFVAYDQGDEAGLRECIERFYAVIQANESYQFIHIPGFNVADLQWTLAESHYLLGEFDDALEMVLVLNPNFSIDLYNEDGSYNDEAVYALAQEIERLESIVRG